uniref:Hexosyltransferase n=1 Tax=Timema bartmani TaxID=61472 RepID=A0A7R9FBZ7_9NEOP|nr:unnamed protein product [Timema bartmani]
MSVSSHSINSEVQRIIMIIICFHTQSLRKRVLFCKDINFEFQSLIGEVKLMACQKSEPGLSSASGTSATELRITRKIARSHTFFIYLNKTSLQDVPEALNYSSSRDGHGVLLNIANNDTSLNLTEHHNLFLKGVPTKALLSVKNIPDKLVKNITMIDVSEQGFLTRSFYESGHYIPNLELCLNLGKHLKLLVVITSAPSHKEARLAIRQTWGHYTQRSDIAIAFLLGSTGDLQLRESLKAEHGIYSDLIVARFVDSYNNLTLKTVSMLEWVDTYCNKVEFILKTDDDMFINIPKLLSFLNKHSKDSKKIYGRLAKRWKPIRNKKSKYYVSAQQFSPSLFPDFTTGPAYLLTRDVIHDLYTKALQKTYLKLEDVFITGIVAQELQIKRFHVNEFLNKRVSFNPCNVQKGISIHMVKYHEQFDLWKKLLDGKSKCK